MGFSANDRMVRLAYWNRPLYKLPQQVKRCSFFPRLIGMAVLYGVFLFLSAIFVFIIGLFGYRLPKKGEGEQLLPIKKWPRILGLRLTPVGLLGLPIALLFGYRPAALQGEKKKDLRQD